MLHLIIMKKIIAVATIILLALLLFGCTQQNQNAYYPQDNQSTNTTTQTQEQQTNTQTQTQDQNEYTQTQEQNNQTQTAPNPQTVEAKIQNFSFSSPTITIKSGDTVNWTNLDGVGHTITADDGSFDSGILTQNNSYSKTFTAPGTYKYHCRPHPYMQGTIVVQ